VDSFLDGAAATEPVIVEVLAGARDERREHDLRRLMQRFDLLRFDPIVDFDAAADIYRTCRRSGITPRGMVDCMIAAVALRHDANILAADADIARLGEVIGVIVEGQ